MGLQVIVHSGAPTRPVAFDEQWEGWDQALHTCVGRALQVPGCVWKADEQRTTKILHHLPRKGQDKEEERAVRYGMRGAHRNDNSGADE
jgi:hypothetical protein